VVDAVLRGGAAEHAGIDPQDELIAVGGQRVTDARLETPLAGLGPGTTVQVLVARDGRLRTLDLVLDANPGDAAKILARADASEGERALCESWLAAPFSAVPHGGEEK
jgi:predicted metalloprotease with PDZ domain